MRIKVRMHSVLRILYWGILYCY